MKNQQQAWGPRSASFWMVFLIGAGISFIGIRFLIVPSAGSAAFGIPLPNNQTLLYGDIKGIRDLFSGLVLLYLLWIRERRITAFIFSFAILIPIVDCLTVYAANGVAGWPFMLIHGGTAVYCIITAFMLFRI